MRAYLSRTSAPTPVLIRAANGFQIILGKVRPNTSPGREPSTSSDHCSYPAIIRLWRDAWEEFIPFLDYDLEIRKVLCSTNAIESLNARYRRAVKARGHFPTEQAGWIQPVRATPGGFSWADSSWSRASAGVRQPSRLRGLLLSCAATYSR